MKKVLISMCTSVMFLAASGMAQTTPSSDSSSPTGQGSQSASPSMGSQSGTTTPDSSHSAGTMSGDKSSDSSMGMKGDKGDKKMKGCIESEGGMYMLQMKHGKEMKLTGQDVSAHVGHEVAVHGMWASGMSGMSKGSSDADASGKSFNVTSVDMISETCNMGKGMGKGKKSGMSGMSGSSSSGSTTTPQQ